MKLSKFLLLFISMLVLGSFVSAYSIELISNTNQCLGNCEAVLKVTTGSLEAVSIVDNPALFGLYFEKTAKSFNLLDYDIQLGEEETYYEYKPIYADRIETISYDKNAAECPPDYADTGARCDKQINVEYVSDYKQIPKTRIVYGNFYGRSIKPDSTYYIKITGRKEIKLGENNTDWIIKFAGIDYKKWAWWNSSWFKRQCYTITNDTGYNWTAGSEAVVDINSDSFNAETTCSNGLDECRIAYNGAEIERSYWNSDNNRLHHLLAANLNDGATSPSGESGYCIYYDNAAAAAPSYTFRPPPPAVNNEDVNKTVREFVCDNSDVRDVGPYFDLNIVGTIDYSDQNGTRYGETACEGFTVNDYIDLNTGTDANFVSGFPYTVECMVYIGADATGNNAIMNYEFTGEVDSSWVVFYHPTVAWGGKGIRLQFNASHDTEGTGEVVFSATDDTWHYVSVGFDADGNVFVNIDGNRVMRDLRPNFYFIGNKHMTFGARYAEGESLYYPINGSFSWCRVSDYLITDTNSDINRMNSVLFTKSFSAEEEDISVTADFNYTFSSDYLDPENGITSITVDLNDLSVYHNTTPNAWTWDQNGTTVGTDQNISLTFTSVQDLNINLDVNTHDTNNVGYSDTNWQVISIEQIPQGIDFTWDVNSYYLTGTDVNFYGSVAAGSIDSWQWKNDGVIFSNDQNTGSYEFTAGKDYEICVTATKSDVNKTKCKTIYITQVIVSAPKDESDLNVLQPYELYVYSSPNQSFENLNGDNNIFLVTSDTTTEYLMKVDYNTTLYYSRYYLLTADGTIQTLQPYLVSVSDGTSMTLVTLNTVDLSRISNVTVRIYRYITGSPDRTLVEVVITDIKGEALISGLTNDIYEYDVYYQNTLIDAVSVNVTSTHVYLAFNPSVVAPLPIGAIVNCRWSPPGGKLQPGQTNIKLTIDYDNVTITSVDVNAVQDNDVNIYYNTFTSITDGWSNTFSTTTDFASWTDSNFSLSVDVNMDLGTGNYYFCRQMYILSDLNRSGDILLQLLREFVREDLGCEEGMACGVTIIISLLLTTVLLGAIVVGTPFRDPIGINIVAMVVLGFFVWILWLPFFMYVILFIVGGLGMIASKVMR